MHDVQPSIPNLLMNAKDKLTGKSQGIVDQHGEIVLGWANPASISRELAIQISNERIKMSPLGTYDQGKSTVDQEVNINWLTRAKNRCDMIRLGGIHNPLIKQDYRMFIAEGLATALVKDSTGKVVDQEKFYKVRDHLAATLGHEATIKRLAAEKAEESQL